MLHRLERQLRQQKQLAWRRRSERPSKKSKQCNNACLAVKQRSERWACRMRQQQEREAIDASWREEAEEVWEA